MIASRPWRKYVILVQEVGYVMLSCRHQDYDRLKDTGAMIIGKNQDMRGKITTMIRAGNGLKLRVTCSHGHISKTIKKNTEISQPDKSMGSPKRVTLCMYTWESGWP